MRALVLLSTVLVFGCTGNTCPDHPICDIRLDECQAAVWDAVQCERGESGNERPPMHVITRDEFRTYLEDAAADETPTPESAHVDSSLQLLGLLAEGSSLLDSNIEDQVANVIAFYSPSERTITVVDRGESMSLESDVVTLAHEMTHAVQDGRYDLAGLIASASTVEESVVINALVEGDATYQAFAYDASANGLILHRDDWEGLFERMRMDILANVVASPSRYSLARLTLGYPLGGAWIASIRLSQDRTALDPLFEDPPTSGQVLMAYHLRGELPREKDPITCATPAAPAGMSVIYEDAFGPTIVFAFLAEHASSSNEPWEGARRVLDDHVVIYGDGEGGRTAVQWRIHTGSDEDLALLMSHAEAWSTLSGHAVRRDGTDLVLAASDDPSFTEWQEVALAPCASP